MSETVKVALITFASGFLGALIGALSAFVSAKSAERREWNRLLHSERKDCYTALVHNYHMFVARITSYTLEQVPLSVAEEQELFNQFQISYSTALLLCSKKAESALTALYCCASMMGENRIIPPNANVVYTQAIKAMQEDTRIYKRKCS